MDALERYTSSLGRRDAALRDGLRAVLVALREQRSMADTFFDQLYDVTQRLDDLEREAFRGDTRLDDVEATPLEVTGSDGLPQQASPPDAPHDGGAGPAPVVAPISTERAGDAAGVRTDNVATTPPPDPLEAILSELDEKERHTKDRFESIQRRDHATREQLKKILAAGRPVGATN